MVINCTNYGNIRECHVLIQDKEDSAAKHKRNFVLAVWAVATVIFFPFGLTHLCTEINKERNIREINKIHPTMSYSKCVFLSDCRGSEGVMLEDKWVTNPIDYDSHEQKLRLQWERVAFEVSLVVLLTVAVACLTL